MTVTCDHENLHKQERFVLQTSGGIENIIRDKNMASFEHYLHTEERLDISVRNPKILMVPERCNNRYCFEVIQVLR